VQKEGSFLKYPDPGFSRVIRGSGFAGAGSHALFRFPEGVKEAIWFNEKWVDAAVMTELEGVIAVHGMRWEGRTKDFAVEAYFVVEPHRRPSRAHWRGIFTYPESIRVALKLGGTPQVPLEFVKEISRQIAEGELGGI
jgi:hypothetical protein